MSSVPASIKTPLEKALNVLSEAAFIYDENMRIQSFNDAAETITGYARKDVLGQKCVALFDRNLCLGNCALCMTVKEDTSPDKVSFDSPFLRKDGAKRMGRFNAGLMHKKNGKLAVLVSLTDVTELTRLKNEIKKIHSFNNIIGKSCAMRELYETVKNIAPYNSTVLIQGESGTGKELFAQAVHYESARADKKIVKVNCSAFSDSLMESELFGHVRGSFTGADRDRIGRFEEADGGTVFLDEIGDLNHSIQVKLLRVLQEKCVERVGENKTRQVDIRIIAATHKNLLQEIEQGRFRQDLYYRLNVVPLFLPPLRERKEDVPHLVRHFLSNWKGLNRKTVTGVSDAALRLLMDYAWPGNVRELENALEHACIKCVGGTIKPEDLPMIPEFRPALPKPTRRKNLKITKKALVQALKESDHNQTQAAQSLEIHRITLWRKMKEFGIPATR